MSACAGTGTKDISSISFNSSKNESSLFFYRNNRYVASAALVKILVNGQEIGKLGVGEFEKYKVKPGQTTLKAALGNILQLGSTTDSFSFSAEPGKNYYFILDYDQKFFTGGWKITETSERGFKNAVQ